MSKRRSPEQAAAEKAVTEIIIRLNTEEAKYQDLHRRRYGCDDERSKREHRGKLSLCEEILDAIRSEKA